MTGSMPSSILKVTTFYPLQYPLDANSKQYGLHR